MDKFTVINMDGTSQRPKVRVKMLPPEATLQWPNAIGETPADAIGKRVKLAEGPHETYMIVEAYRGDTLIFKLEE